MRENHRLFYPHLIRSFATTSAYDRAREAMTSSVSQQACAAAFSARQLGSAARKRASAAPRRGAMRVVAAAAASPQAHFSGESCALTTSVIAPTVEEALAEIVEAVDGGADIVELRVDFIDGLDAPVDIPKMLAACAVPCIVTYRPTWEGGQYAGEEEPRLAALWAAVDAGAAYVDCELLAAERFFAAAPAHLAEKARRWSKIILSSHNYETVPTEAALAETHARCVAAGADIVKIAAMVTDITHVARLEKLLRDANGASGGAEATVVLGMGEAGQTSRLLAAKFGSFLTFGALRSGAESAPGQPTLGQLRELYRVPTQSARTKVMGVIGNPIAQSKSPALHNPSLRAADVDATYVPFLVEDLGAFLASPLFGGDDFVGFSVTIPHKERALELCDDVDPVAAKIGAVNTLVKREDGTLKGYNTDYAAAIGAIERAMGGRGEGDGDGASTSPLKGKTVVVVGAGGAGRGLAFGAAFEGANVVVVNRGFERAEALAAACGGVARTMEDLRGGAVRGDVLANTTSVGMVPDADASPVPKSALEAGGFEVVFDAVYNPLETRLLREAKEAGCAQASGLDMFVGQAARQFSLFTGEEPALDLMRAAVLDSM